MNKQAYKNIFEGKKILVGITGSIAAYKSLFLIRELCRCGAKVFPVLTPSATHFVTELTIANLSKNPVAVEMFDSNIQKHGAWHIDLVHQCDLMIIAPATASTIGKIANGICDSTLVTLATALPRNIPLLVSPAMDTTMWEHPATQNNIKKLKSMGIVIIPPSVGELSSGHFGEGRFPEVPVLLDYIETYLYFKEGKLDKLTKVKSKLNGKNILITSGPTYEKIDDVRYISNFSTGKMGHSLAIQSHILGANVNLISGPTKLDMLHNINITRIESAQDMYEKVLENFEKTDILIMASAVADFTPINKLTGKFKKESSEELILHLKKTIDILGKFGKMKKQKQILVGFALEESSTGLKNAWKKLLNKNCDIIALNYFDREFSGFADDFNTITLIGFENEDQMFIEEYPPLSKNICSVIILEKVISLIK